MNIDLDELTEYTKSLKYSYTIDYSVPINIHESKDNIIMFEFKYLKDESRILTSCILEDFITWRRSHRIDNL